MTSAGEVEQYVYCPHNWLLARKGVDPHAAASTHGMQEHAAAAQAQHRVDGEVRESSRAWKWFVRGIAFACSGTVLTLEVVYLNSIPHAFIMVGATGTLVAGSAALMLLGIINERRYKRHIKEAHLVPGQLVASDLAGAGPLLEDAEWGLKGRPDQILDTKSGWVPVEFKTGATPQRPYPNHVQQVGCYLRLVEVATGKTPEYGLVNYPDGVFRVAWDDALKGQVKGTLEKIRDANVTGKADRDHEQVGRCRGCARRDACEQRLA